MHYTQNQIKVLVGSKRLPNKFELGNVLYLFQNIRRIFFQKYEASPSSQRHTLRGASVAAAATYTAPHSPSLVSHLIEFVAHTFFDVPAKKKIVKMYNDKK